MKILLKNGKVIDGSGNGSYFADILIENEIIKKIAKSITEEADKIIDCSDLIVTPGFIDAHSHNDFFYDYENSFDYYAPFINQGITTQITGNCGFSPFGVSSESDYKDLVGSGLFMAKNPCSFKNFIEQTKNNLYVNIVPLIGHGTCRISVNGNNSNPLSKKQIDEEMLLVKEAMENGAFGGSFGFMYEPGMYAKKDELYAFAKEIANYDGILTIHPRACSKVALGYPLFSKPHIEIAFDEVIKIMKKANVKTEYSHLIFVGKTSWKSADKMLKKFHLLNNRGYKIAYDNYSFTYGASSINVILPSWYLSLPLDKRRKPFNLFKLKLIINITKKLLGLEFSDIKVAYIGKGYEKYEGKTILECAHDENLEPFDMYLKLVDLSNGQGRIYLDKYYNNDLILKLMNDDLSIFMTDAWVEKSGTQNGAAYQGFPYFLKRAKDANIDLEKIIYKMTGSTAERFNISKRGKIAVGNYADLTIFNYNQIEVNPQIPNFTPKGFKYVIINGNIVLNDGKIENIKKGQLLLKNK